MRTTVTLDDKLLEKAGKWAGYKSTSELLNYVLREFVQAEAARRLAKFEGSMPDYEYSGRGPRNGRDVISANHESKVAENDK